MINSELKYSNLKFSMRINFAFKLTVLSRFNLKQAKANVKK